MMKFTARFQKFSLLMEMGHDEAQEFLDFMQLATETLSHEDCPTSVFELTGQLVYLTGGA